MRTMRVVQFLHPGPEHGQDRPGWKDWNCGEHRRKFLLASGEWTRDPTRAPSDGNFTFWGEWEPPSLVRALLPRKEAHYPKWLHEPKFPLDALEAQPAKARLSQTCNLPAQWPRSCNSDEARRQNTDPLVYGDFFRYTICRQFSPKTQKRTKLALLEEGDLILFGSHIDGCFVLDTVFVVGRYHELRTKGTMPNWESDLHRRIAIELIDIPSCGLRLYGGETWSSDKPFSFVPCRVVESKPIAFPRPRIRPVGPLESVITSAMKQNFRRTALDGPERARAVWDAVVDQVLSQGCVLGTRIEEPS